MIKIKRIDQKPENNDDFRILIESTWPNGLSKEKAKLNLWIKDIAPSIELQNWYKNEPDNWGEFKKRYLEELKEKKELIKQLKIIEKFNTTVTLLYSSKDLEHNNASVLLELLQRPQKQVIQSIGRIHGS
jgi:uncharacterized protein YeaO (DUF488 family)